MMSRLKMSLPPRPNKYNVQINLYKALIVLLRSKLKLITFLLTKVEAAMVAADINRLMEE